jgi:hypothetical protein
MCSARIITADWGENQQLGCMGELLHMAEECLSDAGKSVYCQTGGGWFAWIPLVPATASDRHQVGAAGFMPILVLIDGGAIDEQLHIR